MPRINNGTVYPQPPNTGRVYFNQPLMLELTPNSKGDMEELKEYTYNEMKEFTTVCEQEGFGENAIVANKGQLELWRLHFGRNWGIVINLNTHKGSSEVYKPITVKWCADGKETKHWPEELWLIHKAMNRGALDEIRRAQS
jgi:hypothetical protein